MDCPNCGMKNNEGNKFCIKCGTNLTTQNTSDVASEIKTDNIESSNVEQQNTVEPTKTEVVEQQNTVEPTKTAVVEQQNTVEPTNQEVVQSTTVEENQPIVNNINQVNTNTSNTSILDYIKMVFISLIKPTESYDKNSDKISNIKNSLILTGIVSLFIMPFSLINKMINTVVVKSIFSSETKLVWSNLKNINYFNAIVTNFIIYAAIIAGIAGLYYCAGLIFKKKSNFAKLLGIAAIGVIPAILCSFIISPIVVKISSAVGFIVNIIGLVYSFVIIYELINKELSVEGNNKIYLNAGCLSIIIYIAYRICLKVLISSITSSINLDGIMNIFGS